MSKRILFLESDLDARQDLERCLRGLRDQWEFAFAGTEAEVLDLAAQVPCDAVILLDPRLPTSQHVRLLNEMASRHPQTIRFLRYGPEDKEILRAVQGTAPHYLPKGCHADVVKEAIRRAFQVEVWRDNPSLRKLIVQMRLSPSLPVLYRQIVQELQSPDSHLENVAQLIAHDPVICAKMLQLVNSAFFGLARPVSSAFEAVMFLGSAVHIANALEHEQALVSPEESVSQLDVAYLNALGVAHQGDRWREICGCPPKQKTPSKAEIIALRKEAKQN